jgi:hypothetical protein
MANVVIASTSRDVLFIFVVGETMRQKVQGIIIFVAGESMRQNEVRIFLWRERRNAMTGRNKMSSLRTSTIHRKYNSIVWPADPFISGTLPAPAPLPHSS